MKADRLAGLEPQSVFAHFEKLCTIPHGSGNTKQISDYFVSFAAEHGLRCIQDAADNVILFKNGSPGYEDHAPLILQAHMDMVCQKDAGSTVDMATTPLDVTHDGEYIFARGTSLGGDDGIGVAMALAVLADRDAVHPPLEVILTSDEEVGMVGAKAIDVSMLRGRRLWNLDSLSDKSITAGCAGTVRITMQLGVERVPYEGPQLCIYLGGLHGGHSGSLIASNYANANKVMAALLEQLTPKVRLVSLSGGTVCNAIPSSAQAVVAAEELDVENVTRLCADRLDWIQRSFNEPNATLTVTMLPAQKTEAMTAAATNKVIEFANALPNGLQVWSPHFEGLPQTSLNIGVVQTGETVSFTAHIRSNVNRERQQMQDQLKALSDRYGCIYIDAGASSAWEYREDSHLRETMQRQHEKLFGRSPVIRVTHGGLECGVLCQKIPGLDCVSAGPNAVGIHTSRERLEIASVGRMWKFLLEVLKEL